MRNKDTILLEDAYDKVNQPNDLLYVVVNGVGADGYKKIGYTRDYDKALEFTEDPKRWIVKSSKPYFITSNHDYAMELFVEGDSLSDLVNQMNSWEAYDKDFTIESLIESIKNSSYDGDSSFGWVLFANGKPIASPQNAQIYNLDEE